MKVSDFCKSRGISDKTIYRRIGKLKNNVLAGHISRIKGDGYVLDDYAVDYLTPDSYRLQAALNEIDSINCRFDDVNVRNEELYKKLCQAQDERDMAKTKCERLSQELDKKFRAFLDIQHQNKLLQESRDDNRRLYEAECSQHERTRCDLQQAHTDLENANTMHLQELIIKQDEISDQQEQITALGAHCDKLEHELSEKQSEIDSLESMISKLPVRLKKKYFPTFVI